MVKPQTVDDRVHTSRQRAAYLPPPCSDCGSNLIAHWFDVQAAGPNRMFRLAYLFCGNSCEDR